MKIASVCAGDINIVYPAIVALNSIAQYNNFDFFICAGMDILNTEQKFYLDKYNIKLIENSVDVQNFLKHAKKGYDRYPAEFFLKFYLPAYIGQFGYDYAIILDYDILCYGKYNLEEFLPDDAVYSYRPTSITLDRALTDSQFNALNSVYNVEKSALTKQLPQAGVIAFNIKLYNEYNFLDKFLKVCQLINEYPSRHATDETCFGAINQIFNLPVKIFDNNYNQSGAYGMFNKNVKNFHYAYVIKPWNMFESIKNNKVKLHPRINIISYIFACMDYINHIKKYPFKNRIIPEGSVDMKALLSCVYNLEREYRQSQQL